MDGPGGGWTTSRPHPLKDGPGLLAHLRAADETCANASVSS